MSSSARSSGDSGDGGKEYRVLPMETSHGTLYYPLTAYEEVNAARWRWTGCYSLDAASDPMNPNIVLPHGG